MRGETKASAGRCGGNSVLPPGSPVALLSCLPDLRGMGVASPCLRRCPDVATAVRPGPRENRACAVACWDVGAGFGLWFGKSALKSLV